MGKNAPISAIEQMAVNPMSKGGNVNGNKRIARAMIFLIAVATIAFEGAALDYFLLQVGVGPLQLMILSNVLMGTAAAVSLFLHHRRQLEKRQALTEQLETISEMNLHIRSALTSLAFYGKQTENDYCMQVVSESLCRIEDSFRGVVSRWRPIPQSETPLERPQGDLLRNVLKFRTP